MGGAAKLNVGTLVGGGIVLLRRRPGAVLVWMLINLACLAGLELMSRQIWRTDPSGETGGFSYFLVALVLALMLPVLFTAALRAMLRPREVEFASLDVGMDELRVIGLGLLVSIIWSVAGGIVGFITAPLTFALSSGSEPGTGAAVVMVVVALIRLLIPCLVLASISLAFPLVLIRRRILLDEAWRLSEGHVWPLFLAYLGVAAGLTLVGFAILAVIDWPAFAGLFNGGNSDVAGLAQLIQIAGPVDAMTIVRWTLNAAQTTLGIVFMAGAMATAARMLVPDTDQLTDTFS